VHATLNRAAHVGGGRQRLTGGVPGGGTRWVTWDTGVDSS
jgi:hypothetical protein